MQTEELVSVETYLHTAYDPDVDYVDGRLEERNVGEGSHSRLQLAIGSYLVAVGEALKGVPYVEMRVQVGATRFRVPDICFSFEEGFPEILREPPFLVIEILSSEDRVSRLLSRLADYENFGVPFIFVVDPFERQAYRFQSHGLQPITDGVLRTSDPEIVVDIHERFRAIYGQ